MRVQRFKTYAGIIYASGVVSIASQQVLGQVSAQPEESAAVGPAVFDTTLTFRSHQIAAGGSAGNLEGASCPADSRMLAGACHPFYSSSVKIINRFPNIGLNTWRCGFENNSGSTATVFIYTLCGRSGVTETVAHRLQVRRFTTTSLSNTEADTALTDATTLLATNDGPGDVACDVSMSRDGNVTVFADGDGSIDSGAEFTALIGLPGHIKAVNQINWCGALIPNVIGCAPVPGNSLAVVRFTPSLEGILWAHEFGHNKGLSHRNDDPNAVMNGTIGSTRLRITQSECDAFRTLAMVGLSAGRVMAAEQVGEPGLKDIRDFVRQVFIHGVPYEEASRYDPSVIPTLLEMLNDPAEEPHWPNIVVVLGIIDEEQVVEPLISFIEADVQGELSREHYAAKTSALMALGYVINKSGNQRALEFLVEGLNPQTWAAKDLGLAPFQTSTTERNYDFSKFSIMGLALSGNPEAAEALRSLQEPAETETARAFQAQVSDLVSEALKENETIGRQGLADYYRRVQP